MAISLMPLPYDQNALEPAISAETLEFHHGKHHKAYVDKVNALTADTKLSDAPLEEIIAASRGGKDQKLFDQAAQVWNHGFYWFSLNPEGAPASDDLSAAIDSGFDSKDALIEKLVEAATAHFGSGWAWLVADAAGKLSIMTTGDADQPDSDQTPLLVLDVWEHAYYIDRRNDRGAYLKAAAGLLDWSFASENYAGEGWTYPA